MNMMGMGSNMMGNTMAGGAAALGTKNVKYSRSLRSDSAKHTSNYVISINGMKEFMDV